MNHPKTKKRPYKSLVKSIQKSKKLNKIGTNYSYMTKHIDNLILGPTNVREIDH